MTNINFKISNIEKLSNESKINFFQIAYATFYVKSAYKYEQNDYRIEFKSEPSIHIIEVLEIFNSNIPESDRKFSVEFTQKVPNKSVATIDITVYDPNLKNNFIKKFPFNLSGFIINITNPFQYLWKVESGKKYELKISFKDEKQDITPIVMKHSDYEFKYPEEYLEIEQTSFEINKFTFKTANFNNNFITISIKLVKKKNFPDENDYTFLEFDYEFFIFKDISGVDTNVNPFLKKKTPRLTISDKMLKSAADKFKLLKTIPKKIEDDDDYEPKHLVDFLGPWDYFLDIVDSQISYRPWPPEEGFSIHSLLDVIYDTILGVQTMIVYPKVMNMPLSQTFIDSIIIHNPSTPFEISRVLVNNINIEFKMYKEAVIPKEEIDTEYDDTDYRIILGNVAYLHVDFSRDIATLFDADNKNADHEEVLKKMENLPWEWEYTLDKMNFRRYTAYDVDEKKIVFKIMVGNPRQRAIRLDFKVAHLTKHINLWIN